MPEALFRKWKKKQGQRPLSTGIYNSLSILITWIGLYKLDVMKLFDVAPRLKIGDISQFQERNVNQSTTVS